MAAQTHGTCTRRFPSCECPLLLPSQGDYTAAAGPTGFWPDFLLLTFAHLRAAYPSLELRRIWNQTSDGVMDGLLRGESDLTEP